VEEKTMEKRFWLLLAGIAGLMLFGFGCDCGDDDDNDNDDSGADVDDDDDTNGTDDDTGEVPCSETAFQYVCVFSWQGTCIDAYPEDDYADCTVHCDALNARAVGYSDNLGNDYCICCSWTPD
jgi:hypothetical protein